MQATGPHHEQKVQKKPWLELAPISQLPIAGDGFSIPMKPTIKLDNPEARENPATPIEPSHQQENCSDEHDAEGSDNSWIERTLVGVFHELDGAKTHDPQTEEVRRWLNDNIQ